MGPPVRQDEEVEVGLSFVAKISCDFTVEARRAGPRATYASDFGP